MNVFHVFKQHECPFKEEMMNKQKVTNITHDEEVSHNTIEFDFDNFR